MNNILRFFFSSQNKVGFIGTGLMGGPMAINLSKKGYQVFAFDVLEQNLSKLPNENIERCSIEKIAKECDRIITMLPNSQIVKNVVEEIILNGKENTIILDSSTIEPLVAQDLNKKVQQSKMTYVDAPVSGGVAGATNGTLTFMVGCEDQPTLDQLNPILQSMGKNVFICGSSGKGQIAKMCNNMALAIQMASISEAMHLGQNSGIDLKVLQKIMSVSTTKCWSLDVSNPVPNIIENSPSSNDYNGGFGCSLMFKDLNIAKQTAQNLDLELPFMKQVIQTYQNCIDNNQGGKDFGIIFKNYQDRK